MCERDSQYLVVQITVNWGESTHNNVTLSQVRKGFHLARHRTEPIRIVCSKNKNSIFLETGFSQLFFKLDYKYICNIYMLKALNLPFFLN